MLYIIKYFSFFILFSLLLFSGMPTEQRWPPSWFRLPAMMTLPPVFARESNSHLISSSSSRTYTSPWVRVMWPPSPERKSTLSLRSFGLETSMLLIWRRLWSPRRRVGRCSEISRASIFRLLWLYPSIISIIIF